MVQLVDKPLVLKDKAFSVDKINEYTLSFSISEQEFAFCVVDTEAKKCLGLENHPLKDEGYYLDQIRNIIDDHIYLSAGFWKDIKVCIQDTPYALIPESLFEEKETDRYLDKTYDVDPKKENIHINKLTSNQIVSVFVCAKELEKLFKSKYPNKTVSYYSGMSAFINSVNDFAKTSNQKQVFVSNIQHQLKILILEKNKVIFSNQFLWTTPDDFAFYVLYAFKHHFLNQEKNKVTVFGNLSDSSKQFHRIAEFVAEVQTGDRTKDLLFSYIFDEEKEQKHVELLKLHTLPS